jgi:hypothetical protein
MKFFNPLLDVPTLLKAWEYLLISNFIFVNVLTAFCSQCIKLMCLVRSLNFSYSSLDCLSVLYTLPLLDFSLFGKWNIRSLYRAGSLVTVAEETSKYKLDLMGVQEVR